jgi:hypothetical protein
MLRYRFIVKKMIDGPGEGQKIVAGKYHVDIYFLLGIIPVYVGVIREG